MKEKFKLGLIGKNISYSFSEKFFENKFQKLMLPDWSYQIFDLDDLSEVTSLFEDPQIIGLNVTIPYKTRIIAYLDELSAEAEKIGAVNTVLIKNNRKIGYNTDAAGFEKTLLLHRRDFHTDALILGDGGAAKAVKYILDKYAITYKTVSRQGKLNFENLSVEEVQNKHLVIQCTPVGTFPETENCIPFPFQGLTDRHLVIDLIYNPNYTKFLKSAAEYGAKTVNGFYMLEQQAEKAWEIWKI